MFSRSFKISNGYHPYAKLSIPLLSSISKIDESRLQKASQSGFSLCPSTLNKQQYGMSKVYDLIQNETVKNCSLN